MLDLCLGLVGNSRGIVSGEESGRALGVISRASQTNLTPSPSSPCPLKTCALPLLISTSSARRSRDSGSKWNSGKRAGSATSWIEGSSSLTSRSCQIPSLRQLVESHDSVVLSRLFDLQSSHQLPSLHQRSRTHPIVDDRRPLLGSPPVDQSRGRHGLARLLGRIVVCCPRSYHLGYNEAKSGEVQSSCAQAPSASTFSETAEKRRTIDSLVLE